uniref:Uncharacterized protein AlNc14C134G7052 n=1 Tax=Albugo laibachii Nc14 TaxID=890382 RepID=F0WKK1_9STRA|nr:conserved hypothetical protein [Albugo laibachii Nc14]|eukprot:CCA21807.1 conserved hypothetical protein [Albugo laibachii Nc14]
MSKVNERTRSSPRFRRSSTLQRTNTTPVQRQLLGNLNQVQREYKESDAEEEVDEMGDDKEDDVTFFSSQQSSASKYQDFASLARDPNQSSVYERDDINGRNRTFGSARVSFHSHYMKSLSKWIKWSLSVVVRLILVVLNVTWLFLPLICCAIAIFAPTYLTTAIRYASRIPYLDQTTSAMSLQERGAMRSIMEEVLDSKLALIKSEIDAIRMSIDQQDQTIASIRSVQEYMQSAQLEQQKQTNIMDKSSTLSTYVERRISEGIQQVAAQLTHLEKTQDHFQAGMTSIVRYLEVEETTLLVSEQKTMSEKLQDWKSETEQDLLATIQSQFHKAEQQQFEQKLQDNTISSSSTMYGSKVDSSSQNELISVIEQTVQRIMEYKEDVDYASIANGALVIYQERDVFPRKQSSVISIFEALIHPFTKQPLYDQSFTTPSIFSPSLFSARDLLTEVVTPPWLSRHNGRPETALSETMEIGSCWAIGGHQANLSIRLSERIIPTSVSIHHIMRQVARDVTAAPNRFRLWGIVGNLMTYAIDHIPLGSYAYNRSASSSQTFKIVPAEELTIALDGITLSIESNHGNQDYTCLYRFQVHGKPNPSQ